MDDLIARITERWAAAQSNPHPVFSREELPTSYDMITSEWLTDVLCRDTPGARVIEFQLGTADDGNTNRRRVTLSYNEAGQRARLPTSIFCKASHGLQNRITVHTLGMDKLELIFYSKLRQQLEMEAPYALYAEADEDTANYMVILNDLKDADFCTHETKVTKERALDMVSLLATVHAKFSNRLDYLTDLGVKPWQDFCRVLMSHDWPVANRNALEAAAHVIPPRLLGAADRIFAGIVAAVERHSTLTNTMLHGDVHLRNWYLTPAGAMGLCDWQNVSLANWSRDFAYCISCALAPEDRRAWEKDLLRFYLQEMQQKGADVPNFAEAFDLYRLQLFPALGYWTMTYKPTENIPQTHPDEACLEFIRRMATAIDDLDALKMVG